MLPCAPGKLAKQLDSQAREGATLLNVVRRKEASIMADKLVIGCGYLGQRIAARWRAQGHRTFATTRSAAKADEWRRVGLEPIVCDVLDPGSLDTLPKAASFACCIGFDRTSGVSMRRLYVDGLANILAAVKQPSRFLYVSSTSVYGQTEGEEVDETASTEPLEDSGKVVLEAERLLRSRLPSAIILRFAGIYGPGRLMRGQAIKAGEPITGDAEKWLNLIHVDDGADAVLAADERAAPGSIYNVSDGTPVRRQEFYTKLAELLAAPLPRFVPPPNGATPPPHERGHRRVVGRRLSDELGVSLRYLTFERGLLASVPGRQTPTGECTGTA
jgi:nucleoside-diphosphate-sugar epimerase